MESEEEEAGNLFEEPENDIESNENGKSTESSAGVRVAPPKRIVKNPRLKFNPERLCGERGIPVLVDHFKNVKFKGKGHEKEDLDKLMAALEHWTHRLFPSMKFEDCLHQIERLGKKRPVQTCLTKIRKDMPILSSDFVQENEEDNVLRNEDPDPVTEDPFDRLISDRQDASDPPAESSPFLMEQNSLEKAVSCGSAGQVLGSQVPSKISEEQRQIMERNRLLAIERRKAKLSSLNAEKSDTQPSREQTVSFDSILTSSAEERTGPEETQPAKPDAECRTEVVPSKNSPDKSNENFSGGRNDKMDTLSQHADLDTTVKIAAKSANILDAEFTEMLDETLPMKQPFDKLIDLASDSEANVSGTVQDNTVPLEGADNHSGYNETLVLEGQKKTDQFPSNNSTDEHLCLESLMDLVDGD